MDLKGKDFLVGKFIFDNYTLSFSYMKSSFIIRKNIQEEITKIETSGYERSKVVISFDNNGSSSSSSLVDVGLR